MRHSHRTALCAHLPGGQLLTVYLILVLAVVCLAPAAASANPPTGIEEPQRATTSRPLSELSRSDDTDGTLALSSGFRDSLNLSGGRLAGASSRAPRFIPDAEPADPGDEYWVPGYHRRGLNDEVYALIVDGAGNVYAGGWFTTAGGVSANHIVKWNGTAWSALGSGIGGTSNPNVYALAADSVGNVYAGGWFNMAGGVSANRIAKWDGTAWSALGSGMTGESDTVRALATDGAGNVYAGGWFTTAGGVSTNHIAKWDGTAWSALGSGMDGTVYALALDDAGNLYAGGAFRTAGGASANHVAKWDGAVWSPLGSFTNNVVFALTLDDIGNLYAGSYLPAVGGNTTTILKWNGTTWSPLGSGMNGTVYALAVDRDGHTVYAGGNFTTASGVSARYIAKWNGAAWSPLGSSIGWSGTDGGVFGLAADSAHPAVYAGGLFLTAGEVSANYVAKWDGAAWSSLGSDGNGLNREIYALAGDGAGLAVYAGGRFVTAGEVSANHIAKWNGTAWSPLGSGMDGAVYALAIDDAGNLYAGGAFSTAGGVSANNIAQWDGTVWSALGSSIEGPVHALAAEGAGPTVYAGGTFLTAGGIGASSVAKWDGGAWSGLGSGMETIVSALALDNAGSLYAGGSFYTAGGVSANNIAKWDGAAWSALGSGTNGAVDALVMGSGSRVVFAGGEFHTAGGKLSSYIAEWTRGIVVAPIEQPRAGAWITGTVILSGFAIDLGSSAGTGIDAVHLYLDGPYGTGTIIGGATYGLDRPDVAAQYGTRFAPSGWELAWNTSAVPFGVHRVTLYAHRTTDNAWTMMPPHLVVVRADRVIFFPLDYRNQ